MTDVSYQVFGFDGQMRTALCLMMIDGSQRMNLEDTRLRLQWAVHRLSMALGWAPVEGTERWRGRVDA